MKLIATYARVSTAKQEHEETINNQIEALRVLANKEFGIDGYKIIRDYQDEGWSGDDLTRPGLDQLRMDAKSKIWDAVLIYDPDRLARRGAWQEVVSDELTKLGIQILYVTIPPPKTDEDIIMFKMRGVFSEYERMKIKERFRLGKLRKAREGHLLVSEALYGYRYIPKDDKVHGYYEIDPQESEVVKLIFMWVADERMTLRRVVRKLQESNIKPRKSKRGVWNTSTLSTLLRNQAYIGEAHWGRSMGVEPKKPTSKEKYRKVKKSSRVITPQDQWYTILVPAIISREQFFKAGKQLDTNFKFCQRNKKNDYLLSGKILCTCGKTRAGEGPQHGKHLYYRCTDRVNSFPLPPTCHEKGINARIADEMVWDKMVELMTSKELILQQSERWMNAQRDKTTGYTPDIQSIKKEVKKLKDEEDRYNAAYGAGVFTIDQLKEYLAPIRNKRSTIEALLRESEKNSESKETSAVTEGEVMLFAAQSIIVLSNLSFGPKKGIVMNVLDKVIGSQKQLTVSGYIPVTSNVEYKSNHRDCRFAKRR